MPMRGIVQQPVGSYSFGYPHLFEEVMAWLWLAVIGIILMGIANDQEKPADEEEEALLHN